MSRHTLTAARFMAGLMAAAAAGTYAFAEASVSGSPADPLEQLDAAYADWIAGVRSLDAAALARPCGPAEGPYAEFSMATLVLHINREVIHHGAEIACIRDLYTHTEKEK